MQYKLIFVFVTFNGNRHCVEWNVIAKKREKERKKCVFHTSLMSYDFRMTDSRSICSFATGLRIRNFTSVWSIFAKRKYGRKKNGMAIPAKVQPCVMRFSSVDALFSHRGTCIMDTSGVHKLYGVIISSPIYRPMSAHFHHRAKRSSVINVTAGELYMLFVKCFLYSAQFLKKRYADSSRHQVYARLANRSFLLLIIRLMKLIVCSNF